MPILLFASLEAKTYVTLEKVDLDRCASAWLFTRFLDESPKFLFFEQGGEPPEGVSYDFFGAQYFHHGSDCTFTTLIKTFGLSDEKALQKINNDVNDVFAWRWSPGSFPIELREHIARLRELTNNDAEVYEMIFPVFDLLYLKYGGNAERFHAKAEHEMQFLPLDVVTPGLSEITKGNIAALRKGQIELPTLSEYSDSTQLLGIIQQPYSEWSDDDLQIISGQLYNGSTSTTEELLTEVIGDLPEENELAIEALNFRQAILVK
ncbi:chromate resistance protein ChrB domain-containing protein [Rubellicoccus peritrichatus]|uniref:Chromate resistance protein n=1 Tax=Rubellicoccus peritrichatus TaxID=3080537 RepID=A0AAQ3LCB1_9BACT|nr:chromate resistance protein ChrB domain-containing protein [Puniceicoccus sp. CR14]WOO43040.1 chromate resistance protein [Puniceicoccus sp. CR14]